MSYDKGSVVMLYLVQDGAEESTGSFFVYDSTRDTLYPFVKMVNGEHYVIALLSPVDYTMPGYDAADTAYAGGRKSCDGISGDPGGRG